MLSFKEKTFNFQLLGTTFEHGALDLIFFYINLKENRDVRLAFEALKVGIPAGL